MPDPGDSWDGEEQGTEHAPLQIDQYRVRGDPKSWKEVAGRMNAALRRVAVGTVELVADAVEGVASLIRGVTRLPGQFGERIQRAHRRADRLLDTAPREAPSATPSVSALLMGSGSETRELTRVMDRRALAERALQEFLDRLRAKGLHVEIRDVSEREVLIVITRPELADLARELGEFGMPQLEPPEESEPEEDEPTDPDSENPPTEE